MMIFARVCLKRVDGSALPIVTVDPFWIKELFDKGGWLLPALPAKPAQLDAAETNINGGRLTA